MLEIPESNTIARQMNETILGKKIVDSKFHTHPHKFTFYYEDYIHYSTFLKNKTIDRIQAIGGNVELEMGEMRMVLGDGMNLRFLEPGDKIPAKHQLYLEFEDESVLTGSTQMYGAVNVFADGVNTSHYYLGAKEKPSPLSDAFDEGYFYRMLEGAKPNLSAKAFLATEQRIPGLGNGVLQDILFRAGIHPRTKLSKFTDDMPEKLFHCVKDTLCEMSEKGGRDTEKDLFGHPGGYKTILSRKTIKEPCPVCGGWITKQAYLGGNIYFCEHCQPPL